jgi:hypothetical protein
MNWMDVFGNKLPRMSMRSLINEDRVPCRGKKQRYRIGEVSILETESQYRSSFSPQFVSIKFDKISPKEEKPC